MTKPPRFVEAVPLDMAELPNGENVEKTGDEWGENQDAVPSGEESSRSFDEYSQVSERRKPEDAGDKVKAPKKPSVPCIRESAKVDKLPLPGAWKGAGKEKPEKSGKVGGRAKGRG